MRFFLVFDSAMKQFRYVLDESAPADELVPAEGMQRILLGRRTGFAFFRDTARDRKLLVGVFGPNVDVNNYFDGPFDQLPDNLLKGDTLRRALLAATPDLDPDVDRLGISSDGETRELIAPYMEHQEVSELEKAEACAVATSEAAIYQCLGTLAD